MTQPTDSTIRKILSNEFTQVAGICAALWFFVQNVIIPINNIQSSLMVIQVTLADIKMTNQSFDNRITTNSNDILVLKEEMNKSK